MYGDWKKAGKKNVTKHVKEQLAKKKEDMVPAPLVAAAKRKLQKEGKLKNG